MPNVFFAQGPGTLECGAEVGLDGVSSPCFIVWVGRACARLGSGRRVAGRPGGWGGALKASPLGAVGRWGLPWSR